MALPRVGPCCGYATRPSPARFRRLRAASSPHAPASRMTAAGLKHTKEGAAALRRPTRVNHLYLDSFADNYVVGLVACLSGIAWACKIRTVALVLRRLGAWRFNGQKKGLGPRAALLAQTWPLTRLHFPEGYARAYPKPRFVIHLVSLSNQPAALPNRGPLQQIPDAADRSFGPSIQHSAFRSSSTMRACRATWVARRFFCSLVRRLPSAGAAQPTSAGDARCAAAPVERCLWRAKRS